MNTLLFQVLACALVGPLAAQAEISQEEFKNITIKCHEEAGFSNTDLDVSQNGKNRLSKSDLPQERYKCTVTCVLKALKVVDDKGEMDTRTSSDVVDSLMKDHKSEEVLSAKSALLDCAEKQKGKHLKGCEVGACVTEYIMKAKSRLQ